VIYGQPLEKASQRRPWIVQQSKRVWTEGFHLTPPSVPTGVPSTMAPPMTTKVGASHAAGGLPSGAGRSSARSLETAPHTTTRATVTPVRSRWTRVMVALLAGFVMFGAQLAQLTGQLVSIDNPHRRLPRNPRGALPVGKNPW
jgi:hypothetical protein